jgi:hypothetical protein
MPTKGVCLASNYRWVKLDVFNPTSKEVRISVAGVPLVFLRSAVSPVGPQCRKARC